MSKRGQVQSYGIPPCPTDPQHGPLLLMRPGLWYCPHESHHHQKVQTKTFFTDEELMKERDK